MKNNFMVIAALLMSGLSSAALADAYFGASVGSAAYKVDPAVGNDFEEKGTGTKLYGGYTFNKYFAAEATMYNFAEASIGALELDPGGSVVVGASANMKGAGAYAVGMYPVSKKINLMAKLGVLSWSADLSANGKSRSNSGTDAAYGLAASYAFTKQLLAVAEWESFNTDNPELSMLSIGFRFNFN
ncbi:MAG: outer membrane beta-barrel protein [Gammaproteobacteria bacterium]|nr:MAG: outer membrane beta-barrel protein [Gammaproteobacteria bacterium]